MKKRIWLTAFLIILAGILIFVFLINITNKRNTVEKLLSQLEKALNHNDIEKIINLYPQYYQNEVSNWLEYERLDTFYNNVVKQNGQIDISIKYINNYNNKSYLKEIQEDIYNEYNLTLDIKEYQIIIIDINNDSGSVQQGLSLQVVKIGDIFYLYDFGLELLLLN